MLFFFFAALVFAVVARPNVGACFLTRPDCSTALATWLLCLITVFAFIAAYEAARKAGEALSISTEALRLETRLVLGMSLCETVDHRIPRRIFYYVGDTLSESPESGRINEDDYFSVAFDFENLGRTALLSVIAKIALDGKEILNVRIGNIGVDKSAHVVIRFDRNGIKRPTISWVSPARVDLKPLDFTPLPPLTVGRPTSDAEAKDDRNWRLSFDDG